MNITVPLGKDGAVDSGSKLPVYVFVHGGGFAVGSSWYPHYNASPLVKLSVEKAKPIIGISIKYVDPHLKSCSILKSHSYRLGVTGFMTSKELRDAGYKANNGFHDQRAALQWIKKFIGGFGGDPDEITVVGESAGGCKFHNVMDETVLTCSSVGHDVPLLARATHETLSKHRRSSVAFQTHSSRRNRGRIPKSCRSLWARG